MYLKSLEIQGFKSFPDKTILNFNSDITAIVGPNGSGKSNISDAISWVMGEQSSRALRGAKMEDVIFGGTQKRSQVGFAEASLILDNTDGLFPLETGEVMVTRRYYRSGESEYYINKQSARLRDIHELFMDTGLGREGYSNIGQGKIDEILSVKSTDRREVFEEAAGISKYRHRKEETERRLTNTEENLLRIGDKVAELELQRGPLEKQAEQAKKYLEFRRQLKGLEVTSWLDSLERLSETAKKAEADFASAEFILGQSRELVSGLYSRLEQLGQTLNRQNADRERGQTELAALEAEIQKKDSEMAIAAAAGSNYEETVGRIVRELEEQGTRSQTIEEQIWQKRQRSEELEQMLKALEENRRVNDGKRAELAEAAAQGLRVLSQTRTRQAELTAEKAGQAAHLAAMALSLDEFQKKKSDMLQQIRQLEQAEAEKKDQLSQCRKALEEAQKSVTEAGNRIAGYTLRHKARNDRREAAMRRLEELEIQKKTLASKLRMLTEMEREYEGYPRAVRLVMQEAGKGTLRNLLGPVSQNIQVPDAYTVAIEIALGAAMQQIIVKSEADAKAAIGFLKRTNGGRATFLPLTAIRGRRLQETGLESQPGFVSIASQVVTCKKEITEVVENLLGRTVLAETLDDAVAMAKKYGNRFRVVTLDGQVVNAGGSMTGGSVSREAGILSRGNQKRKLTEEAEALEQKRLEMQREFEEAKRAAAETEFQLTAAQGELRQAEDAVLRLEGTEKQVALQVSVAEEKLQSCRTELETLEGRRESDAAKAESVKAAMASLQEQIVALEKSLASLQASQKELEQASQAADAERNRLQAEQAAWETEQKTVRESAEQLRTLQEQIKGDFGQKEAAVDQYRQQIAQLQERTKQLEQEKQTLLEQTEQKRQSLQVLTQQRRKTEEEKTAADRQLQEKNKELVLMERESARLEQKKVTAAMEEKQILDKLWDTYELTPATAAEWRCEAESQAALTRQIGELRRKLSALGTPNLGAIDEFARVNERYQYLKGQSDDVTQAKEELKQIIRSITQEMTEIFLREFAKINTYFGATFTEMFGGGKASVELEDPKDPLSCGIEIRVQPPGKQVKTLTLLSGGEKAFVAIALYFAILKVRPTPFCMVDEIDAALDDRNVERFAAYLRNLCGKTQFIVITHRRGTMEAADTLYGVTMQEEGVSKILSIDLNQVERQLGLKTN